jgi:S-DNA-T family DNA segregation ATPase FtsK/SpoIIIE
MSKIRGEGKKSRNGIRRETRDGIIAVCLFLFSIIFVLSAINKAGVVGAFILHLFTKLLGIGYYLLPLACLMLGISFLKSFGERRFPILKVIGSLIFFFSGLGLIHIFFQKGGVVGEFTAAPFLKLFDFYASVIIFGALLVIAILIVFDARLTMKPIISLENYLAAILKRKKLKAAYDDFGGEGDKPDIDNEITDEKTEDEEDAELKEERPVLKNFSDEELGNGNALFAGFKSFGKLYTSPPLSLLERDSGKPIAGDIKANANIIKRTLQNFGISVEMDEVSIGPSVTRYAIKPAEGVKLSKIAALQDNLSYALAAHPIRIETPIPGKSLVGIEVPNSTKSLVGLASMLGSDEFQQSEKPLLISLGKAISGKPHFGNLGKMPHLLIAGSTGSGKSVNIHTIINSLIFRNSPDNLKFILIDPKRVELTLYNKIPHLLTPVITEAKKAILALKWAAKEMERRYEILETSSVRDVESYHKNILTPALKKAAASDNSEKEAEFDMMPYIIIIIDELADIIASYPRELEAAVIRLAQISRAVGIHLILSTQRPSVNVITGLIKANIPSRIAFQVSSQVDSRTILDIGGAEKLLGAGDMLYLGGDMAKPMRLQSAFISEVEVKKVAKYLREAYADELPSEITFSGEVATNSGGLSIFDAAFDNADEEIDDELYEAAREEVIKAGKASTSYIQRKLRVGYSRAARLMDLLEERGVIGPADGARPREVFNTSSPNTEKDKPSENSSPKLQ